MGRPVKRAKIGSTHVEERIGTLTARKEIVVASTKRIVTTRASTMTPISLAAAVPVLAKALNLEAVLQDF